MLSCGFPPPSSLTHVDEHIKGRGVTELSVVEWPIVIKYTPPKRNAACGAQVHGYMLTTLQLIFPPDMKQRRSWSDTDWVARIWPKPAQSDSLTQRQMLNLSYFIFYVLWGVGEVVVPFYVKKSSFTTSQSTYQSINPQIQPRKQTSEETLKAVLIEYSSFPELSWNAKKTLNAIFSPVFF